jgi:phage terminase large subunit-like protein|uniref:Terminase large subunit n=1 Tax=Siphoviridae sp. ct3r22 TaxID=2825325 RepID=A0A8S5V0T4_9CAUD|nr:MAG TPA: Terminase large subunit [Siphoviridae sp. ct3r22]
MLTLDGKDLLSVNQMNYLYNTVDRIIEDLSPKALNQLLEGYDNDIDKMLKEILTQAEKALYLGRTLDSESLDYIENVKASMDTTLKIYSLNYFILTMLPNFRMGWRNIEWGNMTQLFPWSCYLCGRGSGKSFFWSYAFILWRLWSYCRPVPWRQNTVDNQNRKETCYITSTMTLAKVQIKKVREEIETNDLIAEKLNPNNKASIGETGITTETGSTLHIRGKDGFIRGLHVGAVLCDDMPDESSLYSDEQREKLKELLKGTIEPIVEPYGYFLVCGTPYSSAPNELYQVLKADKRFYCFEYPVIFPDGRPLAPDRYTFDQILAKKEELGTIVFNREYLVVPISDSSTIFPYEYLMRSTIGMENIRFATSIDDYPIKLQRVHIGVDFAVSGNIGADYTVYSVWGIDSMKNYYLLTYYRQKGMSHNEQIDKIVQLDRLFRPNKIVCESNGFQSILSALARERGLKNIETFTTTEGNKKDLYTGLPSLSAMFERGQLKCPYAVGETRQAVDLMFGEFSSITFKSDSGKLEAASGKDDVCMSCFLSINSLRECEKEVNVTINLI